MDASWRAQASSFVIACLRLTPYNVRLLARFSKKFTITKSLDVFFGKAGNHDGNLAWRFARCAPKHPFSPVSMLVAAMNRTALGFLIDPRNECTGNPFRGAFPIICD